MAIEAVTSNGTSHVPVMDALGAATIDSPNPSEPSGPSPGSLKVSHQYLLEHRIRKKLDRRGTDPAREAKLRLEGIQLIDQLREKLQL